MSKGISDTLNMKSLEEVFEENGINDAEFDEEFDEMVESHLPATTKAAPGALMDGADMKGRDHSKAMDEVYDETVDIARKIVDMGMNIDPSRAPRILEVGGQYFKMAMDAKNSKRDAQLKLMKLIQDQKKLELEERRLNGELGKSDTVDGEVIFSGDRNDLLKMLKAQKAKEDQSPE